MAISPIDLQALYMQMDKVGKAQLAQQAALQQAREAEENDVRKAAEAKAKSVQKAETGEKDVGKISDDNASSSSSGEAESEKAEAEPQEAESQAEEGGKASPPLHDGLGKHIDISV